MDEEMKKQVAVFRFRVIGDFVDGTTLSRGETKGLRKNNFSICRPKGVVQFWKELVAIN